MLLGFGKIKETQTIYLAFLLQKTPHYLQASHWTITQDLVKSVTFFMKVD